MFFVRLGDEKPFFGFGIPVTIFVSAFLLFQVQPMMGRYILPWFGGGPAVWSACLLFFQAFLLAGYTYAHWLGSRGNSRVQAGVHIALLLGSLLLLPIGSHLAFWKPDSPDHPAARILLLLTMTAGGPYLLLSATGPLLQRWFTVARPEKSPWRLYALSNLGSFLALLSYPFVIEPFLRLRTQAWIWSILYVVFVVMCVWTALRQRSVPVVPAIPDAGDQAAARPTVRTILFWLALSTCSSTLLVATTNELSQEIAVNPFLWVAALSVYLLTFILAFQNQRLYSRGLFAVAAGLLAPVGCVIPTLSGSLSLASQLTLYLVVLFVTCMLCHGELALSRPRASYLTWFYLAIAAGGALGGVFVALVAPRIFTEFSEYPIGLAAACLLAFLAWLRTGALRQWTTVISRYGFR